MSEQCLGSYGVGYVNVERERERECITGSVNYVAASEYMTK